MHHCKIKYNFAHHIHIQNFIATRNSLITQSNGEIYIRVFLRYKKSSKSIRAFDIKIHPKVGSTCQNEEKNLLRKLKKMFITLISKTGIVTGSFFLYKKYELKW
ncbi:hypothetical protein KFK09_023074 [Dendrobium nobile]|uniref:Uncharacterized protein n=1 Tax=Dendrobium nobile TaxID=94219 RepID=A0A8T3AKW4_DENNO|nr:hypothetical protein KFK09_023074 [Dendrobium nobile]